SAVSEFGGPLWPGRVSRAACRCLTRRKRWGLSRIRHQVGGDTEEPGAREDPQTPRSFLSRRSAFFGSLALAVLASSTQAPGQEEAAKPTQISLRPARAPVPALKYQLLPERRTLVPGNAAIFYHRAVEAMLDKYSSMRAQTANKEKDAF